MFPLSSSQNMEVAWLLKCRYLYSRRLLLKCDGTRAETRFRLSAKRTSLFKSAGVSVQSTTGSRGVLISGSNVGCSMLRGSVKNNGYPLHSPVFSSLPHRCVTVCHHNSTGPHQNTSIGRHNRIKLFDFQLLRQCKIA